MERSCDELYNLLITDMNDKEKVIVLSDVISLLHDVTKDPLNYNYLYASDYKYVSNFLRDSTYILNEFVTGNASLTEIIKYLELCEFGCTHFKWYCKKKLCGAAQ